MTTVQFARRGDQYAIRFSYNAEVVGVIKTTVPSYARSWNPAEKAWTVDGIYAAQLASTLRAYGHQVIELGPVEPPRGRCEDDAARWARLLFRRVGPGRADQVFRALSKCFHPDLAGGDAQLQRELTDAHNELAAERKESA